jgi:hypothetical protein
MDDRSVSEGPECTFCEVLSLFTANGRTALVLQVKNTASLFDRYLNTCSGQGSRTIRTEVSGSVLAPGQVAFRTFSVYAKPLFIIHESLRLNQLVCRVGGCAS